MSHPQQMKFVRELKESFPAHFKGRSVLEVGSLDINGGIRHLFDDCPHYTGLDLAPGKGVSLVCPGHLYTPGRQFGVTCSCEAFEHDRNWRKTLANMYKLLEPGGLLFVTCATTGRVEHGTAKNEPKSSPFTLDHYRNVSYDEMTEAAAQFSWEKYNIEVETEACDLYFWGLKPG